MRNWLCDSSQGWLNISETILASTFIILSSDRFQICAQQDNFSSPGILGSALVAWRSGGCQASLWAVHRLGTLKTSAWPDMRQVQSESGDWPWHRGEIKRINWVWPNTESNTRLERATCWERDMKISGRGKNSLILHLNICTEKCKLWRGGDWGESALRLIHFDVNS